MAFAFQETKLTPLDELKPDVIIIGAGLAGLSAAYALEKGGMSNFVLFEASNRPGGRVKKDAMTRRGLVVDMGAQWLHGGPGNPIYEWLDGLKLLDLIADDTVEFCGKFKNPRFCHEPSHGMIAYKCVEILTEFKHTLYKNSNYLNSTHKPINLFRIHFWQQVSKIPILSEASEDLLTATLRWFELHEAIDNSCSKLSDISYKAYTEWADYDQGKIVSLHNGWMSVVLKLIDDIGRDNVRLNHEVVGVSEDGVEVVAGGVSHTIKCKHVILTSSVGLLKDYTKPESTFFRPPLEAARCDLIQRLGFDVVNKIMIKFSSIVPYMKQGNINFLWGSEDDLLWGNFPRWVLNLTGFSRSPGYDSRVHVGWINGSEVENLRPEQVMETIQRLYDFFLNKDVPRPVLESIAVSRWRKEKFVKGSYSYKSQNTVEDDEEHLWAPLQMGPIQLLFAGEATAGKMYATAHGAIWSGWREAARILLETSGVEILTI